MVRYEENAAESSGGCARGCECVAVVIENDIGKQ